MDEFADQERQVTGVGADYLAMNGYEIEQGRGFSAHDIEVGAPVAVLGAQAAEVFFPTGDRVGKRIRIGDVPVPVRYFDEASSINFSRSVKYGLSTLAVLGEFYLNRWDIRRTPRFAQARG